MISIFFLLVKAAVRVKNIANSVYFYQAGSIVPQGLWSRSAVLADWHDGVTVSGNMAPQPLAGTMEPAWYYAILSQKSLRAVHKYLYPHLPEALDAFIDRRVSGEKIEERI